MAIGMQKKVQSKEEENLDVNDESVSLSFNDDELDDDVDLSFDDDDDDNSKPDKKDSSSALSSKYIIAGVVAVIAIILIVVLIVKLKKPATTPETSSTTTETTEEPISTDNPEAQEVVDDELTEDQMDNSDLSAKDISSEFNTDTGEESDAPLTDVENFVKDLDGNDIPSSYHIADRSYTKDYVNYVKRRAVTDDGMELYWLDVVYHDHNYKIQVPFYVFESLDEKGICACTMEVLTLSNGSKVISYMEVVKDAASRLNQEVD